MFSAKTIATTAAWRLSIKAPSRFSGKAFYTLIRSSPPVYFHESSTSPIHAISLSPDPNALPIGYTSLLPNDGFIPATDSEAADFTDFGSKGNSPIDKVITVIPPPQKFVDNSEFTKLLGKVTTESICSSDLYNSLAEAEGFRHGTTFHVYDMREPPPYGRIPQVQDIIGMVLIQQPNRDENIPAIVPNSFEFNPMYRPLSMNGFVNMGDYMNKKLRLACEKFNSK